MHWIHDEAIEKKLDQVLARLGAIQAKEEEMSQELDDLTAEVQANTDTEQSAIQLITNIAQMLADAGTDKTKLTALKDQLLASKEALAAAIVANTPSA